jgi:hypothetical protein
MIIVRSSFSSIIRAALPLSHSPKTWGANLYQCRFEKLVSSIIQTWIYWSNSRCVDFSRVKERSSDLPLLVKPCGRVSRTRLSSGISHSRRRDNPARFGFRQLFDNLHDLCQMAFSLTLFGGLPFWYVVIRLFLSCCQPHLYPDQNPFAGTGLSFHAVAPCALRHRFCISSACSLLLLWIHPTPLNALVWLSHSGYTSPTFAPSVEFSDPETCGVWAQLQGGR